MSRARAEATAEAEPEPTLGEEPTIPLPFEEPLQAFEPREPRSGVGRVVAAAPAPRKELPVVRSQQVFGAETPRLPPERFATPAPIAFRAEMLPGPAPATPPVAAAPAPAAHDPVEDMNWALAGTVLGLAGSVLLGILSLYNSTWVLWGGLAAAFTGGGLAFMIFLTGGLGTRPSRPGPSVAFSGAFGALAATILVGLQVGFHVAIGGLELGRPAGPPGLDPVELAEVSPEVVEPSPSSGSSPEAPIADRPIRGRVSMVDVHRILASDRAVRGCFVPLYQDGALPPRVDVEFVLQPSGAVQDVNVSTASYRGTPLATCLEAAVAGVTFPRTTDGVRSITYPFVAYSR